MIRVGIIGGAGYTAGELIRLLVFHPEVELVFVHSESNAGNALWEVHGGLIGDILQFNCSVSKNDKNIKDFFDELMALALTPMVKIMGTDYVKEELEGRPHAVEA